MPSTPQSFVIDPQGVSVAVDIHDAAGGVVTVYSTRDGSTPVSLPTTISASTEFFFASGHVSRELSATPYLVSVKFSGVEVAGPLSTTAIVEAHNWQPEHFVVNLANGGLELANLLNAAGGGGGVTFAKQTDTTPVGNPGLFALDSTDPVDGGWMDFHLNAAQSHLVLGVATDDTWQADMSASTTESRLGLYSDGSDVGYLYGAAGPISTQFIVHASVGQTDPLVKLLDEGGTAILAAAQNGDLYLGSTANVGGFLYLNGGGANLGATLQMHNDSVNDFGALRLTAGNAAMQIVVAAQENQTLPLLDLQNENGDTVLSMLQDGSGRLGALGKLDATGKNNAPTLFDPAQAAYADGLWSTSEYAGTLAGTFWWAFKTHNNATLFFADDGTSRYCTFDPFVESDDTNQYADVQTWAGIRADGTARNAKVVAESDLVGYAKLEITDDYARVVARANAGQTAPLLELHDENDVTMFSVDQYGKIAAGYMDVVAGDYQEQLVVNDTSAQLMLRNYNTGGQVIAKAADGSAFIQINARPSQTDPLFVLANDVSNGVFSVTQTAVGFHNKADTPAVQAAAPTTLGDVITILTDLGLCAA